MARYYRSDLQCNHAISTEITGYAASTLVYLHQLTGEDEYLERAVRAARFLMEHAWDAAGDTIPYELTDPRLAYFFDCGIIVRAWLGVWRATGERELLAYALRCGRAMARDFADHIDFHPILMLPGKEPMARDGRWSRDAGCYQLKAALAWYELYEATGDGQFRLLYERMLAYSMATCSGFLPGHSDRHKVMDRLHAYAYFLEGALAGASDARVAVAISDGLQRLARYLREIGPSFVRSDVYAQLLRLRIYAEWTGAAPVDHEAARFEAAQLAAFQQENPDTRIDGGFWFGRRGEEWLPYVNPVSAAFALQALTLWQQYLAGTPPVHRHLLI